MLIARLSDLHVRSGGVLYQGVFDSDATLSNAVRHLNALDPRPDLALLSGDLVDTETAVEYETLRNLLACWRVAHLLGRGDKESQGAGRRAYWQRTEKSLNETLELELDSNVFA